VLIICFSISCKHTAFSHAIHTPFLHSLRVVCILVLVLSVPCGGCLSSSSCAYFFFLTSPASTTRPFHAKYTHFHASLIIHVICRLQIHGIITGAITEPSISSRAPMSAALKMTCPPEMCKFLHTHGGKKDQHPAHLSRNLK
jgi:hypothetical protein